EVDVGQRLHAGEALADPRHPEQRLAHRTIALLAQKGRRRTEARLRYGVTREALPGLAPHQPSNYFTSLRRSAWSRLSLVMAIGVSKVTFAAGCLPSRTKATRVSTAPRLW